MLESELRIEVLSTFEALCKGLDDFAKAILKDADLIAWVSKPLHDFAPSLIGHGDEVQDSLSSRKKVGAFMKELEFYPDQDPREIILLAGFIGCREQTLEIARDLNLKKDAFKKAMLALKAHKIPTNHPEFVAHFEQYNKKRDPLTNQVLKKMGLSQLHLKQCYRKLPILDDAPIQISWTWANTRSIKRISFEEAKTMLEKKGQDQHIVYQLHKLYQLPKTEDLAIVQDLAPHLRSNLVFNSRPNKKDRKMVKGAVPILFPAQVDTPMPKFKPPLEKRGKDQNRVIRADVRLEPEPFLPAIRAHRYVQLETKTIYEQKTEAIERKDEEMV